MINNFLVVLINTKEIPILGKLSKNRSVNLKLFKVVGIINNLVKNLKILKGQIGRKIYYQNQLSRKK